MLYPEVEIKQYSRMQKVIADINNIKYESDHSSHISVRTFGDVSVEYTLYHPPVDCVTLEGNTGLLITYKFASDYTRDDDDCIFDGGYPDVDKYRRFRTKIDRKMWYAEYDNYGGGTYLYRRRFPAAVTIYVTVEDNIQILYIADGIPEIDYDNANMDDDFKFDLEHLPQWADKPQ
jgi:hypothetical protein